MTQSGDKEPFRILITEVGGIGFGLDMDAISEIRRADQVREQEVEIFRLDETLRFPAKIVYESPMVIFIKDRGRCPAILVEQPSEVGVPISIGDIRLLPKLLESGFAGSPIWAVAIRNGQIIILIDPYRLTKTP